MREIKLGLYRHFKGNYYIVRAFAEHSETGEKMFIYQTFFDKLKLYVRPYEMFASEVDRDKYPNATQKYRFEEVNLNDNQ